MRETLAGVRVIRAFVRTEHEEQRFDEANRDLFGDVAPRQPAVRAHDPDAASRSSTCRTVAVLWFGAPPGRQRRDADRQPDRLPAYLMQILFSVLMAVIMFVMVPRAAVSAGPDPGGPRHGAVDRRPGDAGPAPPARRGASSSSATSSSGYPGAEDAGPARRSRSAASRARRPRSWAAPAAARRTLINLIPRFYDVTGGDVLRRRRGRPRDAPRGPLARGSASCPRRRSCSAARSRSNLRYGDEDATDERALGRRCASPRHATSWREMRGPRRADHPGRHERVGRSAPATGHRAGARQAAGDLRLRRQLLGARLPDRRAAARGAPRESSAARR